MHIREGNSHTAWLYDTGFYLKDMDWKIVEFMSCSLKMYWHIHLIRVSFMCQTVKRRNIDAEAASDI